MASDPNMRRQGPGQHNLIVKLKTEVMEIQIQFLSIRILIIFNSTWDVELVEIDQHIRV